MLSPSNHALGLERNIAILMQILLRFYCVFLYPKAFTKLKKNIRCLECLDNIRTYDAYGSAKSHFFLEGGGSISADFLQLFWLFSGLFKRGRQGLGLTLFGGSFHLPKVKGQTFLCLYPFDAFQRKTKLGEKLKVTRLFIGVCYLFYSQRKKYL